MSGEALREPKTPFQRLVRDLAVGAMSIAHHDASDDEPGYIHEVQSMERIFTRRLRGYLSARTKAQGARHG